MLYKYFQRNNAISGRFVIICATERGNNGLKCKKGLETPSQGTRVLLSFKGARLPGQVRAAPGSVGIPFAYTQSRQCGI